MDLRQIEEKNRDREKRFEVALEFAKIILRHEKECERIREYNLKDMFAHCFKMAEDFLKADKK